MKHPFNVAAIAFAVAGSSVATVGAITPASAADTVVVFDPGAVRYGYNDGYWDHAHAWHIGEQPAHMQAYRDYKGAQYYDYAHTRDPNQAWRER